MCVNRAVSVVEAEAKGILEALSRVMNKTDNDVSIEADSLLELQAINKGAAFQLELGHVFDYCRLKLASRPGRRVNHAC